MKDNFFDKPVSLSRDERKRYYEGTEEERELVGKYEKSKFRSNWFNGVVLTIEVLNQNLPKLANDPDIAELTKEEQG